MQQISLGGFIEWKTSVYFWPLFEHFKTLLTTLANSELWCVGHFWCINSIFKHVYMGINQPWFSGPIASSFVNKYGCRMVTIIGAIIAAGGLALSMFATSITYLFFSVGVCTGKVRYTSKNAFFLWTFSEDGWPYAIYLVSIFSCWQYSASPA